MEKLNLTDGATRFERFVARDSGQSIIQSIAMIRCAANSAPPPPPRSPLSKDRLTESAF